MTAKRGWALIQISEPSDALSYVLRYYYLCVCGGVAGWHGVAGVVSFVQENGKPLEWPSKRVRDQKGCRQLPPRQTGLLTVPSPVPHAQDQELGIALCELRLVSPVLSSPPQLSTRLWALVPSHPWLRLQNPLGRRGGGTASGCRTAGACSAKCFARAVRDRQARGEFGACGAGGSSGWAGEELWLPLGLLNPVEMTDPPPFQPSCTTAVWVW